MTGIDVARIFGISKHTVYRLDKEGIEEELSLQKPIKPKTDKYRRDFQKERSSLCDNHIDTERAKGIGGSQGAENG